MKRTKHALLLSAVSMLLCLSMLVGSTFAWFTDTASTGVNKIVAGNLDVELEYNLNGTDWLPVPETTLFTSNLWEPGHTEYVRLRVRNAGSLALKYQLSANVYANADGTESEKTYTNVDGGTFKLSEQLVFNKLPITTDVSKRENLWLTGDEETAAKGNFAAIGNSNSLASGGKDEFVLAVYMPTSVGNEANHRETENPEIYLGITVNATQDTVESDSFNNQYDAGALFPNEKAVASNEEFVELINKIKSGTSEGVDTVVLAAGEYDMFAIYQNLGAYEINIIGATNADGTPATTINMTANTLWGLKGTIKNITFKDSTNSKILKFMDGNSLNADVVVDNCVFDGASMQFTGIATVKNSVFKGNDAAWSGIQYSAPGGDILIEDCKFSGYRFTNLQVTDEGAHKELTVTVKDCEIGALKSGWTGDYSNEGVTLYVDNIVLENNTIDCDVWTPTFANVTKTDNKTSAGGEVSYKNW